MTGRGVSIKVPLPHHSFPSTAQSILLCMEHFSVISGPSILFECTHRTKPFETWREANMAPLPFLLVVDGLDLNRPVMGMPYVPMENDGVLCCTP